MKNLLTRIALLTLALMLLATTVHAEDKDPLKGIFNELVAEGSSYTANKKLYEEYFEGAKFEETLESDRFTIAINGNEDLNGSWTFVREGDTLTLVMPNDDYNGFGFASFVLNAVGEYYGMNTSLLNNYISGLYFFELENPYFVTEQDDEAGTTRIAIDISGPYDMKELDRMLFTPEVFSAVDFGPLTEEYTSRASNVGKLNLLVNGDVNNCTIMLGEYGGLDDLAYASIINTVSVLRPVGWEEFVNTYTELRDANEAGYSVDLDPTKEMLYEHVDELPEGRSFAVIRFGSLR